MILNENTGTHDMYLPAKRAQIIPPRMIPDRNGTQAEREAWMRQRQSQGTAHQRSKRAEIIFRAVCEQWGVTRGQLLSRSRAHSVCQARGQACRELRKLDMSYPEIARALNLKQHTSVMYHCEKGVL